jgi:uncharacterized integral membrane protein
MNRLLIWSVGVPLALVSAIFAISNRTQVSIDLWLVDFSLPLFLAVLLPLALGLAGGLALARLAAIPVRRRTREQARRIESLERQLGAIKGRPDGT